MALHVPPPASGDNYGLADAPTLPATAPSPAGPDVAVEGEAEAVRPDPATQELAPTPVAPDPTPIPPTSATPSGPKIRPKRRRPKRRFDMPAWVVSTVMHVGLLGGLALATAGSSEVIRHQILSGDTKLGRPDAADELTRIYADPADAPRDSTTGNTDSSTAGAGVGVGFASANGAAAPSATPAVARSGRAINERTALPTIPIIAAPSGLQPMATPPNRDLGKGGMIAGDVAFPVGEVGEALDQVAYEILRHVAEQKVTVAWLFDESESMRDDQKEIKKKFDRVVNELRINQPDESNDSAETKERKKKTSGPPLNHAIVGFGDEIHFEQDKPTADIDLIGRAIDHLRIDTTGKENTMTAVARAIAHYNGLLAQGRKLLLVLVTDESGDDGDFVEEARQAAVSRNVPVYVIGRQSLFGFRALAMDYTDPVTKDVYRVHIDRGPETAATETLQWDGIHRRWDEQPSGFAPYELARLTQETGGVYFLLPSEEGMRIREREKAFSTATLKEYIPDYKSRPEYLERRAKSELRRTMAEIIQETRSYPFRHAYPVLPEEMIPQVEEDIPLVTARLATLIAIEKRLRELEKLRNREPEKRWQADYDLMLAQIVAYQIKAYEYRACLLEMLANPPRPKQFPSPELTVQWWLNHAHERKAPKENTEQVYAEATRLFNLVKERHPNTPWADLADDELRRGFSVRRDEWHHKHTGRYEERAKLVPKF